MTEKPVSIINIKPQYPCKGISDNPERRNKLWNSQNLWHVLLNQALDDKKGEDIQVIDISQVSVLADYFIIANGNSESQVRALVDNVEEELSKAGYEMKQERRIWLRKLGADGFRRDHSSMFSTKKTVCSMIWNVSGETESM